MFGVERSVGWGVVLPEIAIPERLMCPIGSYPMTDPVAVVHRQQEQKAAPSNDVRRGVMSVVRSWFFKTRETVSSETPGSFPPVSHVFQRSEITRWIATSPFCPLCRQPIEIDQFLEVSCVKEEIEDFYEKHPHMRSLPDLSEVNTEIFEIFLSAQQQFEQVQCKRVQGKESMTHTYSGKGIDLLVRHGRIPKPEGQDAAFYQVVIKTDRKGTTTLVQPFVGRGICSIC